MEVLEIRKSKHAPFQIARVEEDEKETYVIVLGNTKMETKFKSFEAVEKWVGTKPYKLIFMLAEVVYNHLKTNNNGNN